MAQALLAGNVFVDAMDRWGYTPWHATVRLGRDNLR